MEKYINPVLFCDYSDPDCIRVDEEYFLVASSFNFMPGLPVLRSKDLVHYEIISYVCDRLFKRFDDVIFGDGIWAPAIRYHKGIFYVVIPVYDEGIYVSTSTSAYGPWSKMHLLNATKGLIDPCPFWDKDGKTYIVCGFAKSRIGFNSKIGIFEVDEFLTTTLTDYEIIYDGTHTQPVIEGPKTYYINEYYYILAPAGSVKTGWQLALRSKSIKGPFEEKVILMQGDSDINGPHQGALIDLPNNEYAFIHFQDLDCFGRVVHLQEVKFIQGWPICGIDTGNFVGIPARESRYLLKKDDSLTIPLSDDFKVLNKVWQWPCNINSDFYRLDGGLKLRCIESQNKQLYFQRNMATQKLTYKNFTAHVTVSLDALSDGCHMGFAMMGFDYGYLEIEKRKQTFYLNLKTGNKDLQEDVILKSQKIAEGVLELIMEFNYPNEYQFYYQLNGIKKTFKHLFKASKNRWTGARLALFAYTSKSHGYAIFNQFILKEK